MSHDLILIPFTYSGMLIEIIFVLNDILIKACIVNNTFTSFDQKCWKKMDDTAWKI